MQLRFLRLALACGWWACSLVPAVAQSPNLNIPVTPFALGQATQPMRFSQFPLSGIVTADLNLDGREDVISWHDQRRQVVVYHTGTGGQLTVAQVLDLPPIEYFVKLEARAADVNGDGRRDLILFEHGPADFAFFLTQTDGTLAYSHRWRNENNSYALFWKAADVSGDGRADLVFSEDQNKMAVAVQQPDGTFSKDYWPINVALPGFTGTEVYLEDIDGDEDLDAAWPVRNAQGQTRTLIYRNQGFGRFLPGVAARQNSGTGAFLGGALVPDLTGDGLPDLVAVDAARRTTAIWQGLGTGVFRLTQTVNEPISGTLAVVDWNADGMAELIADEPGRACYWLNQGRGIFRRPACERYTALSGPVAQMERVALGGVGLPDRVFVALEGEEPVLFTSLSVRGDLRLSHPPLPLNPLVTSSANVTVSVTALTDTFVPPTGSIVLLRDGRELLRFPLVSAPVPSGGDSGIAAGRTVATANVKVPFDAGFYALSMVYEGDPLYLGARTFDQTFSIAPIATTSTLALSAREFTEQQELTATVRVAPTGSTLPPDGIVSLMRDGRELASMPLTAGTAVFRLRNLQPGPGSFQATYLPARNYFPSTSPALSATVVGLMQARNPFTGRTSVAPGSLVEFEAESFPAACDFRLSYGPMVNGNSLPAGMVAANVVQAVLLPGVSTGAQTLRILCGEARWEGRATVAMLAPGIAVEGVYLNVSRPNVAEQATAVDPKQALIISPLLSEPSAVVRLTLLGTGWRNASALSQYAATLNNTRLTVASYGPHPTVLGLDQVILTVPATFRPPPSANTLTPQSRLQLTVGGVAANAIDLLLR
jgi:hypothetical protein